MERKLKNSTSFRLMLPVRIGLFAVLLVGLTGCYTQFEVVHYYSNGQDTTQYEAATSASYDYYPARFYFRDYGVYDYWNQYYQPFYYDPFYYGYPSAYGFYNSGDYWPMYYSYYPYASYGYYAQWGSPYLYSPWHTNFWFSYNYYNRYPIPIYNHNHRNNNYGPRSSGVTRDAGSERAGRSNSNPQRRHGQAPPSYRYGSSSRSSYQPSRQPRGVSMPSSRGGRSSGGSRSSGRESGRSSGGRHERTIGNLWSGLGYSVYNSSSPMHANRVLGSAKRQSANRTSILNYIRDLNRQANEINRYKENIQRNVYRSSSSNNFNNHFVNSNRSSETFHRSAWYNRPTNRSSETFHRSTWYTPPARNERSYFSTPVQSSYHSVVRSSFSRSEVRSSGHRR